MAEDYQSRTKSSRPSHGLYIKVDNTIDEDEETQSKLPYAPQRQSSFAQPRPDGAPRTPNRVRFNIDGMTPMSQESNGHAAGSEGAEWVDEEDYAAGEDESSTPMLGQRHPLLTDIEAPSVTMAMEFDPEDHLESARPRSNMSNAFMNMANSIMSVLPDFTISCLQK
jgi:hypothetical protein